MRVTIRIFAVLLLLLPLVSVPVNGRADSVNTLAIFPFENNCGMDTGYYSRLGKNISLILMTELGKYRHPFTLVDRDRIAALIEELEFSQSVYVDQATAIRMGKILGAKFIAFGSFMVVGQTLRVDARIIRVETSTLLLAESVSGDHRNVIPLVEDLARKIAGKSTRTGRWNRVKPR